MSLKRSVLIPLFLFVLFFTQTITASAAIPPNCFVVSDTCASGGTLEIQCQVTVDGDLGPIQWGDCPQASGSSTSGGRSSGGSSALGGLETAAGGAGLKTTLTAPQIIAGLINALIGLTGIVFVLLLIYAGILYMTASGDTDKVKKSKGMMIQAVIGIVIVVSAYAIAGFVFDQLIAATGG